MTGRHWIGIMFSLAIGPIAVAQEVQKPTLDRSAEPKLRAIMTALAARKNFDAEVLIESREAEGDFFYIARQFAFRKREGKKYRLEFADYWGDYRNYVIDEKAVLLDPLDSGAGVTLSDAKPVFWDSSDDLKPEGDYASVIVLLCGGEGAFETLVKKDGPVFALPDEGGLKRIRFHAPQFGAVTLAYKDEKSGPEPRLIAYDAIPKKNRLAAMFPEWVGPPLAGTLDIESIRFVRSPRLPKGAFETKPPKGLNVIDLRKKEAKKPPDPQAGRG